MVEIDSLTLDRFWSKVDEARVAELEDRIVAADCPESSVTGQAEASVRNCHRYCNETNAALHDEGRAIVLARSAKGGAKQ